MVSINIGSAKQRSRSMPQLVKGGKHVFGWSRVGSTGWVTIPPEALEEYHIKEADRLIVVPGSRTSGGFGLASPESVKRSLLGVVMDIRPELAEFRIPEGEVVECQGKPHCWLQVRNGGVTFPPETLEKYGIAVGDKLLVIRGSGLAVGFAVRGPIVDEAGRHDELEMFEPGG
jgi:bifunctional DNA-binding transcriptional regulator/antitoxin component of YhaV-PrlF toxin-antitoxin module